MKDGDKTKKQLIDELTKLRQRITQIEKADVNHKQTQEALDFEHLQLILIFDSMDEPVYISTPDTYEVLYVNQALKKIFGDVAGKKCHLALQGLKSPCPFCTNKHIFGKNEGKSYIWESQNRINQRWYRCIDKAIRWSDGRMVRYEIAIDITERKKAEEALRESEEKYRNFVERANDGIAIIQDKLLRYVNPRMAEMTGYTFEDMINTSFTNYLPPDELPKVLERYERRIRGEPVPEKYESGILHKDGRTIFVEFNASIIKYQGQSADLVIVRDITHHKKAKEALETERLKLKGYYEHLPLLAYNISLDGKIIDCNNFVVKTLGYKSKKELIGKTVFTSIYAPSSQEKAKKLFLRWKKTGTLKNEELQVITKQGKILDVLLNADTIYDKEGKPLYSISTQLGITELKQTEEALQEKEALLRNIIESMSDGIFVLDRNFHYTYWNRGMEKISKVPRKKTLESKKVPWEIFPHLVEQGVDKMMRKAMKDEVVKREDIPYRLPDGTSGFTSEVFLPLRTSPGEISGIVGVVRDMTKRKQAEEALRESEKKYRTLTDNVNVGVYRNTAGPKGNFIEANPAMIKMFGYKNREDFFAKNVSDLYQNPEDRKKFSKKVSKDGFVRNEELQLKKKDGTPFIGSVSAVAVKDEKGKVKYYDGITQDITERKKAEEALRESEEKFRNLAEQSPNMIFINQKGRVIYANKKCEEVLGYKREELYSPDFNFITLIAPEFIDTAKASFKKHMSGQEVPPYEYSLIKKDKRKFEAILTTKLIRYRGEIAILGISTDISERKQTEKQLQESLKEKEVLLREIHHRVKNNMQIISSLLNLQLAYIKDKKVAKIFNESRDRIRSMALVHEKLYQTKDLSKIDFSYYIQSLTAHLFRSYKTDPNIVRLETDVKDVFLDINTAIPCGLIINELVSNSLKHAFPEVRAWGEGGKSKGKIHISLYPTDKRKFTLVIQDNGVGFPQDMDIRKSESLGLQLVNDLVGQLNGSINLQRNGGTSFTITFEQPIYKHMI